MASLINVSQLTINPEEAKDVAQLIIEKGLLDGNLAKNHAIVTGIDHKMQIPFAGNIPDSLAKSTGCTPNEGAGVTMTEKFWDPVIYDTRFSHCQADLPILFKLFQRASKINPDFYDKIDSQELGIIFTLVTQMLNDTLPTKIWFSDKTAETVANGGVFKNGTNLALYNPINGLFKQIFTEVPAGSEYHTAITENAGASYALQALGADAAFNYLADVMNNADSRLLLEPGIKFQVTRTVADNYRNTIRNKNLGAGFLEVINNGVPTLLFDGVPVEIRYDWDRDIKALQDNGTKLNLPHRIVLTTPENIPVGTMSEDDLQNLDSFYDRTLKSNIVDVAFTLDAKLLETYMISVAY
jgi:hypothetical protein